MTFTTKSNPLGSKNDMELLSFDEWLENNKQFPEIQDWIAKRLTDSQCDMAVLDSLSMCRDEGVRVAVARNQNTPPTTLKRMFYKENKMSVIKWLSRNPRLDPEIIHECSMPGNENLHMCVAVNPKITVADLERLSLSVEYGVRMNVARNDNTQTQTLDRLGRDASPFIRQQVFNHPNVSKEIKDILALDAMVQDLEVKDKRLREFEDALKIKDASDNIRK
jgi:hypothetical protein